MQEFNFDSKWFPIILIIFTIYVLTIWGIKVFML